MPLQHLLIATLRALFERERLLPIGVVCGLMVLVQGELSGHPLAGLVALALCGAFVLLGPFSYRALVSRRPEGFPSAIGIVTYGALGALCVIGLGHTLAQAMGVGRSFLTDPGSLTIATALFWVGGWGLGRDIDRADELARARQRARALERAAMRAQLLAVRSHLDPHFLFNTLGAIAEWCREDAEAAEQAILQLSSMLRTILSGVREDAWPLEQELGLVRDLAALHAVRDPGAVTLDEQLDGDLRAASVPPMLVLVLMENALKHGPWAGHRGGIQLLVRVGSTRALVQVSNAGPFGGERPGSQGLPNLRERLLLAYGAEASFTIGTEAGRTVATLDLPLYPAESEP